MEVQKSCKNRVFQAWARIYDFGCRKKCGDNDMCLSIHCYAKLRE